MDLGLLKLLDKFCYSLDNNPMILWQTNFKLNNSDLEKVLSKVATEYYFPEVSISSSFFEEDRKQKPEAIFYPKYKAVIQEALEDLGLLHRIQFSIDYWIQVYSNKSKHRTHDHWTAMTFLSWVHFVKPVRNDCFYFLDSNANKVFPQQEEGDFIMFPSWALHEARGEDNRAVMAGNVLVDKICVTATNFEDCEHTNTVIKEGQILSTEKYVRPYVDWSKFL